MGVLRSLLHLLMRHLCYHYQFENCADAVPPGLMIYDGGNAERLPWASGERAGCVHFVRLIFSDK